MKFGGTSVEDGPAFDRVARIVYAHGRLAPVVVVSAMAGVTDALMTSLRIAAKGEIKGAARSLEEHFERHLRVTNNLGTGARTKMQALIDDTRQEIYQLLKINAACRMSTPRRQDAVSSHGERLSANLLAIVLEEYGLPAAYVDARNCILTNANFGSAEPLVRATSRRTRANLKPLLAAKKIPVMGGFIGATLNGLTTTLGRGSSDYTATLVSAALKTREVQIWTDVNGVHTADPSLVRSARTVAHLSYTEAAELARLGARVLHPKMIQPLLEKRIPIRICNSRAPEHSGTLICPSGKATSPTVKAIAHQTNLTRIDVASTPVSVASGLLRAVRKVFNQHRRHMEIVAMSETGISFACEGSVPPASMVLALREIGSVRIKRHRAMISCVGEGLLSAPGNAQRVLNIASDIDPTMAWRSTSSLNLMSMVKADSVGAIVTRLHEEIFERRRSQKSGRA